MYQLRGSVLTPVQGLDFSPPPQQAPSQGSGWGIRFNFEFGVLELGQTNTLHPAFPGISIYNTQRSFRVSAVVFRV